MNDSMNVAGNEINMPDAKAPRTRSRFPDMSYHLYNTERFGEYSSNFVMECVEGDKVSLRSGGSVQSYTLRAPLMQSISKKKDYYMVPMEAILPYNWQKFYTNPVIGDDVPDDCGTGVVNFWDKVGHLAGLLRTNWLNQRANRSAAEILTGFCRVLVCMEYWYSNGSLIRTLGCNGSQYVSFVNHSQKGNPLSFDQFFDQCMNAFSNVVGYFYFEVDGVVKYVINDDLNYGYMRQTYEVVSLRSFLQYLRDDLTVSIQGTSVDATTIDNTLAIYFDSGSTNVWEWTINRVEVDYNLARLWSYQLVCAHFYSNDHVDYIYSADLLRQLVSVYTVARYHQTFSVNGVAILYDAMCAWYFNKVYSNVASSILGFIFNVNTSSPNYDAAYFSLLFSYRRSLRFVDYFTGSRTRPLAVGNVTVNVNNNQVDIVDVSRNIQRQRFFNAVNRFGRKFEEYIKGLSGVTPSPDYHNPLYLAHTSDTVYGTEVENTGANQWNQAQSVTSRLVSNGSRYQFEFSIDRPCVVIGITYYDINRSYLYNCERQLLHMNRFDMFNPFMQFIGDQTVNLAELGVKRIISGFSTPFGYQLRHMEYKQRSSMAAGGFVENLPGYLFTDVSDAERLGNVQHVQSVDFIRSLNTELDPFYLSLTGYSLGSYFHFIVDNDNYCDPSRPMAYAPTIL